MPAHDVIVTGEFSINSYKAVFKIGEDVVDTIVIVYGQPVVSPEAPEKEGHTFAGWQNVPETMPAKDLEIYGSYTVNSYSLLYKVDGEIYEEYTIDYGTQLTPEVYPEKEGYTFSGWDGLPSTMPAHDVIVTGEFSINSYTLRLYLNEELYHSELIEYGDSILIEDPIVPTGMKFDGWSNTIPKTMPAYDVDIYGTYSLITTIDLVELDDDACVVVCTLNGYILCMNELWCNVKDKLGVGLYIINGVKYLIR